MPKIYIIDTVDIRMMNMYIETTTSMADSLIPPKSQLSIELTKQKCMVILEQILQHVELNGVLFRQDDKDFLQKKKEELLSQQTQFQLRHTILEMKYRLTRLDERLQDLVCIR
jgi:hypothetical protein